MHAQARQKQERRGRHRDASITGEDGEEKKEKRRRGDRCSANSHARAQAQTAHHTRRDTFTRSADRSISSRLRAGESLAMVLSVDTGLKMEASPTTIDREVQSGGEEHAHTPVQ